MAAAMRSITFIGWFVFFGLILVSVATDGNLTFPKFKFSGKVDKYGCRYLNNKYELDSRPIYNPQYGDVAKPLVIADVKELEILIKELKNINRDVIEQNIFNSVDIFLEFHQAYRKYRSDRNITGPNYPAFVSFFKGFKPTFIPRDNVMGQTIELLDQISQKLSARWPKIKQSIYPVSYEPMVTVGFLKTLKTGARIGKREMTLMAAVTKISYVEKVGYIISAPSCMNVEPQLVMEDGSNPLKALAENKIVQNGKFASEMTILPYNKNYIVKNRTAVKYDNDSHEVYSLFYVGQPYCSFLDTTGKYSVLQEFCSFLKRNSNGVPVAGFHTMCLPLGIEHDSRPPRLYLFAKEGDKPLGYRIKSESLLGNDPSKKLKSEVRKVIRIANKDCGFPTEDGLINKLKQLAEIIVKDEDFLISVLNIRPHLQELETYDPQSQPSGAESEMYYKKHHSSMLRNLLKKMCVKF